MDYKKNNVKFIFSTPVFGNNKNVYYSYKVDGFDDKWSTWSNSEQKEYTNLSEGRYTMLLKSRNNFGQESKVTLLSFKVRPPWYRSIVVYLIYSCLIAGAIFVLRLRIAAKIRKNKYYETIEQRRIYLEK